MPLRGTTKPKDRKQRLKLLLSSDAGVGKTTAAIQMPQPYLIDTEQGSVHYGDQIQAVGGAVFETQSVNDIITEVRSLMTEEHEFKTLVIDPITTVYNEALDEAESRVGSQYGRHYGEANKVFKRLCNLLTLLDMNIVVTAHEKVERFNTDDGEANTTYEGFKKLHYIFDLWLQLERDRKSQDRMACVAKTRLHEFPDGDRFPWRYEELVRRYGRERLEKGAEQVQLATPEQVERFRYLMNQIGNEGVKVLGIDKVLKTVDDVSDLTSDRIAKGIEIIENYRKQQEAA